MSDLLDEGPVSLKTMVLSVKETYYEMDRSTNKLKPKTRDIGEVEFRMRDVLENAKTSSLSF